MPSCPSILRHLSSPSPQPLLEELWFSFPSHPPRQTPPVRGRTQEPAQSLTPFPAGVAPSPRVRVFLHLPALTALSWPGPLGRWRGAHTQELGLATLKLPTPTPQAVHGCSQPSREGKPTFPTKHGLSSAGRGSLHISANDIAAFLHPLPGFLLFVKLSSICSGAN